MNLLVPHLQPQLKKVEKFVAASKWNAKSTGSISSSAKGNITQRYAKASLYNEALTTFSSHSEANKFLMR